MLEKQLHLATYRSQKTHLEVLWRPCLRALWQNDIMHGRFCDLVDVSVDKKCNQVLKLPSVMQTRMYLTYPWTVDQTTFSFPCAYTVLHMHKCKLNHFHLCYWEICPCITQLKWCICSLPDGIITFTRWHSYSWLFSQIYHSPWSYRTLLQHTQTQSVCRWLHIIIYYMIYFLM